MTAGDSASGMSDPSRYSPSRRYGTSMASSTGVVTALTSCMAAMFNRRNTMPTMATMTNVTLDRKEP